MDPRDSDSHPTLGELLEDRAFEEVLKRTSKLLGDDPNDMGALHARAAAEFALGEKEGFRKTVEDALAVAPDSQSFLKMKAIGLAAYGDFEEARRAAEAAVALDEASPDGWVILSEARDGEGDGEGALEAAEKAVELDADAPRPSSLRALASAAITTQQMDKALEAVDLILEIDEADIQGWVLKTIVLMDLERPQEAMSCIEHAYGLGPEHPNVLRARAATLFLTEEYQEAELAFRKWIEVEPNVAEAWTGLGLIYSVQDEWEQAASALRRAFDLDAADFDTRAWLGIALIEVGESAKALTHFKDLSVSRPDDEEIWLGRAAAERALDLTEDAISSARRGLEAGGYDSADAWLELARCYSAAGRHQSARRAFKKALTFDRDSFDAAIGVAVESILCNNEAKALSEIQEAERRLGPHALLDFNRGVALYKLGKEGAAYDAWRRALQLDPELGAAEVLISGIRTSGKSGSWTEYWFGPGSGIWRRLGASLLLLALMFFLLVPFLEEDLIPGVETGDLTLEAFVPSVLIGLLITLPAIRGLAVGNVSLDVSPLGAPNQGPTIDPAQVLPVFRRDELDVARLTRR